MTFNGKKISLGWLLVLVALMVFSVLGLHTKVSESLFDLPGDHSLAD